MILDTWARHWGINPEAVADLRMRVNLEPYEIPRAGDANEAEAQALVQLEASKLGLRLWRNNVGAAYTADGKMIRYGLANPSKAVNERVKSSDLIGIRSVMITQAHVGTVLGVFVAREIKRPGWKYSGSDREPAQLRFLDIVLAMGGDAAFATGPGTL